jgi:multiple sugar transport system ATP-binding protein
MSLDRPDAREGADARSTAPDSGADDGSAPTLTIRFDHVWKMFGEDVVAVSDLNLEIREGEFLVLVGPSGCGKTTSLRMLACLERPSHGRIWMGEQDVTDLPSGKRDAAMVFQSYALYPHMTVYKNLAFGPKVRKEPRAATAQRIKDVAQTLGMAELLDRHPSALSGGQRQRVALGRALIREPRLFLLDEPLSNLDAALRLQMRAELIRLHTRLERVTTVYVTHDQVEALTMGSRVAVLRDGVLLQIDTPTTLYDHPANAFVAEFIGSPAMNLHPGQLESTAEGMTVTIQGVRFRLPESLRSTLSRAAGGDVLVGIRPHDLNLAGDDPNEVTFKATVDVSEHTGTEVFATVVREDAKFVARLPRSSTYRPGDNIEVSFNPNRLYLFDAATEATLFDSQPSSSDAPADASGANRRAPESPTTRLAAR